MCPSHTPRISMQMTVLKLVLGLVLGLRLWTLPSDTHTHTHIPNTIYILVTSYTGTSATHRVTSHTGVSKPSGHVSKANSLYNHVEGDVRQARVRQTYAKCQPCRVRVRLGLGSRLVFGQALALAIGLAFG